MSWLDDVLARLGWVRLRQHNLVLTQDGRVIPAPEAARDDWQLDVTLPPSPQPSAAMAPRLTPPPVPRASRRVAVGTTPPPVAEMEPVTLDAELITLDTDAPDEAPDAGTSPQSAHGTGPSEDSAAEATGKTEEEWEWRMAMARAKSSEATVAPSPVLPTVEPPRPRARRATPLPSLRQRLKQNR